MSQRPRPRWLCGEHVLAIWIIGVLIPIAVATGEYWIIGIAVWMGLALWIMSSPRFADPAAVDDYSYSYADLHGIDDAIDAEWDKAEDWWQAWLDGRL